MLNAPGSRPTIESLTMLRGFLALWVVGYHFLPDVLRLIPEYAWLSPLVSQGHFAVPGFFILSGFVLSYTYAARFNAFPPRGVLRFWGLRLARVYPVHLATLLAVAVMVQVANRTGVAPNTHEGYTARDFVLNLLLAQTWVPDFRLNWNYPSWSISSEWFAYLLFPLAAPLLLRRLSTPSRAAAFASICVATSIGVYTVGPFPFRDLVCVVPTFFAGAAIDALVRHKPGVAPRGLIPWAASVLLVAGTAFAPGRLAAAAAIVALFWLIWSLAAAGSGCAAVWRCRPLVYLGEVSYSLYMTHTLAQKVLYKLLPSAHYEAAGAGTRYTVLAAYLLLVGSLCLASYYLIERPARVWVRWQFAAPARGRVG